MFSLPVIQSDYLKGLWHHLIRYKSEFIMSIINFLGCLWTHMCDVFETDFTVYLAVLFFY